MTILTGRKALSSLSRTPEGNRLLWEGIYESEKETYSKKEYNGTTYFILDYDPNQEELPVVAAGKLDGLIKEIEAAALPKAA